MFMHFRDKYVLKLPLDKGYKGTHGSYLTHDNTWETIQNPCTYAKMVENMEY